MTPSQTLILHGAIVMLVGSFAGFPYGIAIKKDKEDDIVRAWRVAHSALSSGGLTMVAIASAIAHLQTSATTITVIVWASVLSGYGFCVALTYGAVIGQRGLSVAATVKGNVVFIGNRIGVLGSFIAILALIYGCIESAIFCA